MRFPAHLPARTAYRLAIDSLLHPMRLSVARLIAQRLQDGRRPVHLLEVGCATGAQAVQLARRGLRVTGVDIAPQLFPAPAVLPAGLRLLAADALDLPFASGRFDAAFSSLVLHGLEREARLQALREMFRVVRAGGVVLLLDWSFVAAGRLTLARGVIKAVERLAAGGHHRLFRDFLRRGGLAGLLGEEALRGAERFELLGGSAALFAVEVR